MADNDCLFCRIAAKQIPSKIIFEDDDLVAIEDINPAAPVHILLIPRDHRSSLNEVTEADQGLLGHIQITASALARQLNIADNGYRLVCNCGMDGGQTVLHIHYHLLGGRELGWPPG